MNDPRIPCLRCGLAMLAALSMISGCRRAPADSASSDAQAANAPLRVEVIYPKRTDLRREVSQPGAIEAFEETPMFAKIAGYVKEGWKDIGARLRKGEILAELQVPELEDELRQKEALIEQAQAAIAQAREAVTAAEKQYYSAAAQVEAAQAKRLMLLAREKRTRQQYERLQRVGGRVLDREQIEEAQLGHETAKAGVVEAESQIKAAQAVRDEDKAKWNKTRADLRVAQAQHKVAEKNRDYVKDLLGYTRLTAPYDCIVVHRAINTGDFVRSATAGEGKPLYLVHRTDRMRVVVEVPEKDAAWVREGTAARLRIQVLPGREIVDRVARISSSLDRTTRTLRAEIDLSNSDGRLRPGMYVHASLSAEIPNVVTLPRSLLKTEGDVTSGYQTYCYQVVDGQARRLFLDIGSSDGERVEVLRKRMRTNDPWQPIRCTEAIVRGDLSQMRDGRAVQIGGGGK